MNELDRVEEEKLIKKIREIFRKNFNNSPVWAQITTEEEDFLICELEFEGCILVENFYGIKNSGIDLTYLEFSSDDMHNIFCNLECKVQKSLFQVD